MSEEKRARDRALLGALHPGLFDGDVSPPPAPNIDGGTRESALPTAHFDPRPPAPVQREPGPGGWVSVEVDAELLFPWLSTRRR